MAFRLAVLIESRLHIVEDVLRRDRRVLHVLHLGDIGDLAAAVADTRLLDDEVDGGRDLLADGAHRQLEAAHEHHRLETGERVARVVGMGRRERAVMTGVHGLQHVERLAAADLADDDAVRTHTQGVLHEVADRDLALALDVRGTRLERHDMRLLELQLGRVLDGDDTLALGDERRDDVERRRLTGASTAGDEDVDARLDARAQELRHLLVERAERDEVLDRQRRLAELSDRERRPDERERRDDDVDTGAVLEARVHERRRLVDAAAERREDALDDVHQMRVVMELHIRELELAHALDEDLLRPVDHDLCDAAVLTQRLDGPEAEHLVTDIRDDLVAITARDGERILFEHLLAVMIDDELNLPRVGIHTREDLLLIRLHLLDDALMDPLLDF